MPMERPFSESDWLSTPEPVRRYVESLAQRIEQPESRLNQNSQNSNKPPSSDPPYQRPERGDLKNPSVAAEARKGIRVIGNSS
jgi:transposase